MYTLAAQHHQCGSRNLSWQHQMWQCSMWDNVPLHGCTVPQSHSEIVILLVPRTDPVPLMGALVWVLHCCLLFAAHAFYTSPLPNNSTHMVSAIEMDEDPQFFLQYLVQYTVWLEIWWEYILVDCWNYNIWQNLLGGWKVLAIMIFIAKWWIKFDWAVS